MSCIQQGKRVRTFNKPENPQGRRTVFSNSLKGAAVVHSTETNVSLRVCVSADVSKPLMGRLQEECGTVSLPANCPSQAIVDVSENMRAKIYSLFCKIGFTDLPGLGVEDHVTLTTIEKYLDFKMGEVWTETMKELEVGVVLLLQANCDIHWWWVFGGQRQWWWVFGGQRQQWWVFGEQAAVVGGWWTETAVVGVWWTETEVVGVWWTEIGGGCLVGRDCDGGCLVDRLQ